MLTRKKTSGEREALRKFFCAHLPLRQLSSHQYKNCVGLWILFIKWRKLWGTVWRISCFLNGVHIIFPQMSAIMWMQSKCQRINKHPKCSHAKNFRRVFHSPEVFSHFSVPRNPAGQFFNFLPRPAPPQWTARPTASGPPHRDTGS